MRSFRLCQLLLITFFLHQAVGQREVYERYPDSVGRVKRYELWSNDDGNGVGDGNDDGTGAGQDDDADPSPNAGVPSNGTQSDPAGDGSMNKANTTTADSNGSLNPDDDDDGLPNVGDDDGKSSSANKTSTTAPDSNGLLIPNDKGDNSSSTEKTSTTTPASDGSLNPDDDNGTSSFTNKTSTTTPAADEPLNLDGGDPKPATMKESNTTADPVVLTNPPVVVPVLATSEEPNDTTAAPVMPPNPPVVIVDPATSEEPLSTASTALPDETTDAPEEPATEVPNPQPPSPPSPEPEPEPKSTPEPVTDGPNESQSTALPQQTTDAPVDPVTEASPLNPQPPPPPSPSPEPEPEPKPPVTPPKNETVDPVHENGTSGEKDGTPEAQPLKSSSNKKTQAEKDEEELKKRVFAAELGTGSVLVATSIAAYVASYMAYTYVKKVAELSVKPKMKNKRKRKH